MPEIFANLTIHKIKSVGYLSSQTDHAKRVGPNIELRPDAVAGMQLRWSIYDKDERD